MGLFLQLKEIVMSRSLYIRLLRRAMTINYCIFWSFITVGFTTVVVGFFAIPVLVVLNQSHDPRTHHPFMVITFFVLISSWVASVASGTSMYALGCLHYKAVKHGDR